MYANGWISKKKKIISYDLDMGCFGVFLKSPVHKYTRSQISSLIFNMSYKAKLI